MLCRGVNRRPGFRHGHGQPQGQNVPVADAPIVHILGQITNQEPPETAFGNVAEFGFDFDGAALGSYTVTVAGPERSWTVSVVMLTGSVQVAEIP